MTRVARALVVHELSERLRDRWVVVVTALFALLASGVALYGRSAEESAAAVTAPSIVTLAAFFVTLVTLVPGHDAVVGERERHTLGLLLSLPVGRGEVLVAKYAGRGLALLAAVGLGLGVAALLLSGGQRVVLLGLLPDTMLLGLAFLSIGIGISALARRHATAASMAVAAWFLLVLFWDLGVLAALVATDGALSTGTVAALTVANPAGLYRTGLLEQLGGGAGLEDLGLDLVLPSAPIRMALWAAWIAGPVALGALLLGRNKAVQS